MNAISLRLVYTDQSNFDIVFYTRDVVCLHREQLILLHNHQELLILKLIEKEEKLVCSKFLGFGSLRITSEILGNHLWLFQTTSYHTSTSGDFGYRWVPSVT